MTSSAPVRNGKSEETEAAEVLEILNNWDRKFQGHHREKRDDRRVAYSVPMCLFRRKSHLSPGEVDRGLVVWARNISQTGIGFVYKGRIQWRRGALCLDPKTGAKSWFRIEIVRNRKVHNDFWEYGARFTGRTTPQEVLPSITDINENEISNGDSP